MVRSIITLLAFALSWVIIAYAEAKCTTAYFAVPARFVSGATSITSDFEDPELDPICDGNLDPTKYYEVVSIDIDFNSKNLRVGDRFTGKSINVTGKGCVKQLSSQWPLATKVLSGFVVGYADNGKAVVHVVLPPGLRGEIKNISGQVDPLSDAALEIAKLKNAFIGKTIFKVFEKFPEFLDGRYRPHHWSCEQ